MERTSVTGSAERQWVVVAGPGGEARHHHGGRAPPGVRVTSQLIIHCFVSLSSVIRLLFAFQQLSNFFLALKITQSCSNTSDLQLFKVIHYSDLKKLPMITALRRLSLTVLFIPNVLLHCMKSSLLIVCKCIYSYFGTTINRNRCLLDRIMS